MMIVRKSSIFYCAPSCLSSFSTTASQSSTSSNPLHWNRSTRPRLSSRNAYATIEGDARGQPEQHEKHVADHTWPEAPAGHAAPTPYQIFDLKRDGAYSKARFYQLVKMYHPDLNGKDVVSNGVTHQIKVERYRLIVAANTILSDPVKRGAYDRFGAGWNGRAEVGAQGSWSKNSSYHAGPFSQNWHDPSDPVWQNATWEDWERWRESKETPGQSKRAPVYMANSYFLAVVVALAIIGSSLNGRRASEAGAYLVEQRDFVHDRAAKDLRKVKQEASGMSGRQDRIEFFIRQREAMLGGSVSDHQNLRDERANRLLRDREVCGSEGISERKT